MMQFLWRYVDDLVGKGLEMTVLAQFFFYSILTLIPVSLPLAVLLASLITFGNFGERFELLAMKAAGISLFEIMRPLMVMVLCLCCLSFYFQNYVTPKATAKLYTLLISIRQKSPELDIPEGVFYDEIDGINIYVKTKEKSGLLKDVIIYELSEGFDNARIIIADSARLTVTADKQHLFLHLFDGELFENLRAQGSSTESVPYRRETFVSKHALIEFDGGFNMVDESIMDQQSGSKNMAVLKHSIDSMSGLNDSIGVMNYNFAMDRTFDVEKNLSREDSVKIEEAVELAVGHDVDSIFQYSTLKKKQSILNLARRDIESMTSELGFKEYEVKNNDQQIRRHQIEWYQKMTLSISCLVFFFIGAPLGGIIRKGGLGMPVVISVLIFIVYYIINTIGAKMATEGQWEVWSGIWLSTIILAPIGAFLTYKSNNDSVIMNADLYVNWIKRVLGIRPTRHLPLKEVVIDVPNYEECLERLNSVSTELSNYLTDFKPQRAPNYIKLWFDPQAESEITSSIDELESIIEELSNSEYQEIINVLNKYPIIPPRAHTRPFEIGWLNNLFGVLVPLGLFFYFRIWIFRVRLSRDIKKVLEANKELEIYIERNK